MLESLCSICHSENFKYKCPSCGTRTCSLICVKRHKLQTQCSGQKDPTEYIKKDEISLVEVNRDYNFLLNVNRKISVGKEDAKSSKPLALNSLKRPFNGSNNNNNNNNNKRIYTNSFEEGNVAVKRGVNVKYVPKGMSRSNINKTGYDKKKDCFNWTIEWLLIDDDLSKVLHRFTSYKCNEAAKLINCFPRRNFVKFLSSNKHNERKEAEDVIEQEEGEEHFEFNFFLRNYKNPTGHKLHILDPENLIANLLRNKTVLEFPTIYVSLTKEIKGFQIIDENVESESDLTSDSETSDSSDDSDSDDSSDSSDEEDGDAPEESSTKPVQQQD